MKRDVDINMSLTGGVPSNLNTAQKVGLATGAIGFLFLILALFDLLRPSGSGFMWASILMLGGGVSLYVKGLYQHKTAGIKNDGVWFSSLTNKGVLAWIAGILITAFYVLLYWYPELLGQGEDGAANNGIIAFFDPLAQLMKGQQASEWFVYGVLYTTAILFMGVKFLVKYRHNRYQLIRTASVMFFQLAFAFMLPEILEGLHNGTGYFGKDLKNIWPLNFYFFDSLRLDSMQTGGMLGRSMLFWGIVMIVIGTPVLTYFYGKRWYCSWVCGCGGLAETAGDPFRQLSDKSNEAWQIERIIIYGVLALVTITTSLMIYTYFTEDTLFFKMESTLLNKFTLYLLLILLGGGLYLLQRKIFPSIPPKRIRILIPTIIIAVIAGFEWKFSSGSNFYFDSYKLEDWYGFFIYASFSGVIGVGFYPILGSRIWCRFGCPQAAILGLWQRFFSRFRITTNGGQCISCGNCSTYCEMGIDVRSYAQRGQSIVRSSCVGCGICAAVCPRGVLRLENGGNIDDRTTIQPVIINSDDVNILR